MNPDEIKQSKEKKGKQVIQSLRTNYNNPLSQYASDPTVGGDISLKFGEEGLLREPARFGNVLLSTVVNPILNAPRNLQLGSSDIGKGIGLRLKQELLPEKEKNKQLKKESEEILASGVGRTIRGALDLSAVYPTSSIAKIGTKALVAKETAKGAGLGAISGVASYLENLKDIEESKRAETLAKEIGISAAIGGISGGAIALGGEAIGKGLSGLKNKIGLQNIEKPAGKIAKKEEITGDFVPTEYVKTQVRKQKEARIAGKPSILQSVKNIANEIDVKFQDFTTPINQAVNRAIKEGKKIDPTKNPIYQIDRVLRSNSLATQKLKDYGFSKTIQNVDNLDEFNQYLIAKSTIELGKLGKNVKTGRNLEADRKLVQALDSKYSASADEVFYYNQRILQEVRASGLISGELFNVLFKRKEYVPLNRIFSEIEEITSNTTPRAVASVSKQNVIQKLKGSEREIENPLESILTNTYKATAQIERNIAAKQIGALVKAKKIPGKILNKNDIADSNEIISYLDNGEKVRVFVGRDIARAAKNLNKENTNLLTNLVAIPTRLLQIGAVGLNLPFVVSNLTRDQFTAAINSGTLRNTILNPVNFARSLFSVYSDGKLYDDYLRAGAGFTSLDLARDTAKGIKQLRAEKNIASKFLKIVTSPSELLSAVEDFIGKAETVTRLQVFKTTREDALKRGLSPENAEILAADAARNITANFARRGEFGTVLNAVIPFFNATVQGSRALRDAFVKNPAKTTVMFATTVGIPTAVTTLWNISDPERKKAYDTIPEYEKERNFVILPPVLTYDDKGKVFHFRIPKPQGYNQIADPIRKLLEKSYENLPDATVSVLNNILSSTTGYALPVTEESRRQTVSSLTPQIMKPVVEAATGVNLFTGQDIVPRGLQNLPPEEQVKDTTSFTARQLGRVFNVSPLLVENTIRTSTAGTGQQLLNLLDRSQFATTEGAFPKEQIGGVDPLESVLKVFYRASGGEDIQKIYDAIREYDKERALLNLKVKDAILKQDINTLKALAPELTSQQFKSLERSVSEKEFAKTLSPQDKAIFNLTTGQLESLRNSRPDLITAIDNVSNLKDQVKGLEKIDTAGLNFKITVRPLPKAKGIAKIKKGKRRAKIRSPKLAKIKKTKQPKFAAIKLPKLTTSKQRA